MKLSTIFANAADFHLWNAEEDHTYSEQTYSCISIKEAVQYAHISREQKRILKYDAVDYAAKVAEQHSNGVWFYNPNTKDRQSERYIWLKFLSLYAKEEGV